MPDLHRTVLLVSWATLAAVAGPAAGASGEGGDQRGIVHKLPGGERQYELLLPAGEIAELKNLPLVMYLHPAGQPATDKAATTAATRGPSARLRADWWPLLAKRRCALVLAAGESAGMWRAGEEQYLLDVLADVQTRYSVDAKRIILLGVSGGAQAALFLADHAPEKFRAVIAVSSNPVVVRGQKAEWFYPARKTPATCPYFVTNPLTQGSALMYWRQVQARLAGEGAGISIVPLPGSEEFPKPPEALGPWLEEVLAGRQPKPLEDAQKQAVAKWMAPLAEQWARQIGAARGDGGGASAFSSVHAMNTRLAVAPPGPFVAAKLAEPATDSTGAPMHQLRLEHKDWPIYLRWEVRQTERAMEQVLADEEKANIQRGVLYQLYQTMQWNSAAASRPASGPSTRPLTGSTKPAGAGGLAPASSPVAMAKPQQPTNWRIRIGSITYPDRRRGWVSALFAHASSPLSSDGKRWVSVVLTDETQQPDPRELAGYLQTALSDVQVSFPDAATKPGRK